MTEEDIYKQNYETFVRWYSIPESIRDPKTIYEYCEQAKITLAQVAKFQREDTFTDDLVKFSLEWGKSKIPELLGIVYQNIKINKNINHIKSFTDLINSTNKNKNEENKKQKESKKQEVSLIDLFKDE